MCCLWWCVQAQPSPAQPATTQATTVCQRSTLRHRTHLHGGLHHCTMAADGDGGGGDGGDSVAMSIPEISEMFWGGGVMKDAVSPLHGPALTDMVGAQHARMHACGVAGAAGACWHVATRARMCAACHPPTAQFRCACRIHTTTLALPSRCPCADPAPPLRTRACCPCRAPPTPCNTPITPRRCRC